MNNFRFHVPTDLRFGRDQVLCLPEELKKYGENVLLVYGGGSIKKTGLYDKVLELLEDFSVYELPGVEPNPKISSVRKGVDICKEKNIDVILAVGGGSTVDASKNIACGAFYDGDPWDLVLDGSKIKEALPIAVVLTINATGTEMNVNAVISNEETNEKLAISNRVLYPVLSICDPTYLYTLPVSQTAAGTADIFSHVVEQYFQPNDEAFLTDCISESVLKTCIKYCPVALHDPKNYEARSNLMWASTVGLNSLCTVGKGGGWSCHPMEHELSAYYDITHGVGLAILTPAWMRYILCEKTVGRFVQYAQNVWGVSGSDSFQIAEEGIRRTQEFFIQIGLPSKLSEVGIGVDKLEIMAKETIRTSTIDKNEYYPLQAADIQKIFESCL